MRLLLLVLLAPIALAGCANDETPPTPTVDADQETHAPWWEIGESWTVDLERPGVPTRSYRLVNFWNDSETSHFWLGVIDRSQALDMALHDTNPLLGRIHWGILTPHEAGMHAQGMYTFPVKVGDQFSGLAFGREWRIDVAQGGEPGQLLFTGVADDGATIEYDYSVSNRWLTYLEIKTGGATELRMDVTQHETGAKGTYYFLRGRDYYLAENPAGTHDDPVTVKQEDIPHKSLALEIKGSVSGPLSIQLVDPDGRVQHAETLAGGNVAKITEIPSPKVGAWTMRYVGTGSFTGTIEVVGVLEYSRTL